MNEIIAYHVTGVTRDGRRFKRIFDYDDFRWAMGINLYRGSVWAVDSNNKRKLIKRVYN